MMSAIQKIKNRERGWNRSAVFWSQPFSALVMALSMGVLAPVQAMESVSDEDLSEVAAQDGLTLTVTGKILDSSATSGVSINPDTGTGNSASLHFVSNAANPMISAINNQGVPLGGAVTFNSTVLLDIGGASTTSIDVTASWNRMRLQTNNQLIYAGAPSVTPPAFGTGAMALDGPGSVRFKQQANALFDPTPVNSANNLLHLTIGTPQFVPTAVVAPSGAYGQFYYRQGAAGTGAELVLDKLYFDAGFTPGTGGVVAICGAAVCNPLGYGGFATGRKGLYIGTPHLDFNFTYAINFRAQPLGGAAGGFRTDQADVKGMAYWGWTGGFNNAELLVGSGGIWGAPGAANRYNPNYPEDATAPNTALTRSEGLNIGFQADFDPNAVTGFTWLVGQAGGREVIGLANWLPLDAGTKGLSASNISLDVMTAGAGAGGLCWGAKAYGGSTLCTNPVGATGPSSGWGNGALAPGSTTTNPGKYLDLPPTTAGLALAVRNLNLQAYSNKVTIFDDMNNNGVYTDANETKTYQWALIYTLGQVDGNVYYYPGNVALPAAQSGNGVTTDVLFMTQSFYPTGTNTTNALLGNTNFMIADTAPTKNLAIGFAQSNLLFAAKALNISLVAGLTGPGQPGGIRLQSNDIRFEEQGMLGGGTIPVLAPSKFEKISYVDANIQGSGFDALLYPDSSNGYPFLGYAMKLKLGVPAGSTTAVPLADGGAFITLAEPSSPNTSVTFSNIQGDINVTGGRVFLISASDAVNSPDGIRRLQIAQTMQLGTTAVPATGTAITTDAKLGSQTLGTISIPSGQIYSSVILKPQI